MMATPWSGRDKDEENRARYRDELMSQAEWDEFWSQAPRQAEVDDAIRRGVAYEARLQKVKVVADWRARHPAATCSDETAYLLAGLEAVMRRPE